MTLARALPAIICCLALGAAAAACGGGSTGAKSTDSAKVPTATLPAKLPEPKIIGSGAVQAGGGATYVVKAGDSWSAIAARVGVTLEDLLAANSGIDQSTLQVGQSIKLPPSDASAGATASPAAASTAAASATPAPPTEPPPTSTPGATSTPSSLGQTYTVQAGDIPVTIAEKFGVTVEALLAANPGIDPTALHIGDVLVIPKPAR